MTHAHEVCMYVCLCVCMYACVCMPVYVFMYACLSVWYVCMYVHKTAQGFSSLQQGPECTSLVIWLKESHEKVYYHCYDQWTDDLQNAETNAFAPVWTQNK